MTSGLPPNLLRLFAPRPPLPFLPPVDPDPKDRKLPKYTGLSEVLDRCVGHDVDYVPKETALEKQLKRAQEKKDKLGKLAKHIEEVWDPTKYVESDPYKTLFVSNLAYETTEKQLRRTMEAFGDVKSIKMIMNESKNKPKGYAFVEFERESGMKAAYKEADGIKLNNRRMLVDVERGRTVKGWKPKKLGGGLGKKRDRPEPRQISSSYSSSRRDHGSSRDRDRDRPSDRDRHDRDRDRDRSARGGDRRDSRGSRSYHDRDAERRRDTRRDDSDRWGHNRG
ncbi:hypothetical protein BC833DRAFT_616611 [Globomyces pollinis-pini]|nr:hypothetical protein BC833DRAFT_616611 [Globomyces pollinis-pini]